jgi:hypothetical protein
MQKHGFRLVTLTNSSPAAVEQQLKNAGLTDQTSKPTDVDLRSPHDRSEIMSGSAVAPPTARYVHSETTMSTCCRRCRR